MNYRISGHHVDVTPSLTEYVKAKLRRVETHFDQIVDIRVTLTVEHSHATKDRQHKAEALIQAKGKSVFAEATASDMYAALDLLSDKLERACQRRKESLKDHRDQVGKRSVDELPMPPMTSVPLGAALGGD